MSLKIDLLNLPLIWQSREEISTFELFIVSTPRLMVYSPAQYWANTWKMCSPASVILTSIATILVSFEAILKRISVNFNIRSQFQSNFPTTSFEIDQNRFKTCKYCDNTCEYYTCRWTHFSSIGLIFVSIISILTSIDTILVNIEQVNRPIVKNTL